MTVDHDPARSQRFQSSFIRLALDLDPIRPRVTLFGIKKPMVETRFIAQK